MLNFFAVNAGNGYINRRVGMFEIYFLYQKQVNGIFWLLHRLFLLYQKHKICYFFFSLRGGTFRVKVPQKRGGSDSPAPLNGLGFHPKTP